MSTIEIPIKIYMQDDTVHECKSTKIEDALLECGLVKELLSYEESMQFIWPLESGIKHIEYSDDTDYEKRLIEWRKSFTHES